LFWQSAVYKYEDWKTQSTVWRFVSMGVTTWSPTLQTEHTLRISENRVLRNISEAKAEKVAGD